MRVGSLVALLLVLPAIATAASTELSVESLAANGQQVRDLTCRLSEGGMFAMVGVVAALAEQKRTIDACAPEGAAFKVKWTWSAKPTDAQVEKASLPKAKSCVEKALRATRGPTAGTCTGIVLAGPVDAAEKAAEPMRAKSAAGPDAGVGGNVVESLAGLKDGESVTVEGRVAKVPWQHLIDRVAGKSAQYFDLAGGARARRLRRGQAPRREGAEADRQGPRAQGTVQAAGEQGARPRASAGRRVVGAGAVALATLYPWRATRRR
ncbi:MAG: hypothetical protein QM765_23310 [Myxococcales bacterium]